MKALGKGLLKTISKMGISTIQSYCGAQIFEAVGLDPDLVRADLHRHGIPRRRRRHGRAGARRRWTATSAGSRRRARCPRAVGRRRCPAGRRGAARRRQPAWRRDGERRQWDPTAIALLQDAARTGSWAVLRGVRRAHERGGGGEGVAARADGVPVARGRRHRARRGRAGGGDRAPVRHRGDVARLAVARGARDARDRDEPDRRQVELRRGRGGPGPLRPRRQRRPATVGDPPDRVRALRGQHPLPRQRRRAADQDRAGREARRGRPAARQEGRQVHRVDPLHDPGRVADLAAAAPRHLLDRGPQAAHLRPALREPVGAGERQARRRGRGRHRRRRRRQGGRGPHPDLGPRRRHGRVATVVDPVGRRAVGDRTVGDAADARARRPAHACGCRPTGR